MEEQHKIKMVERVTVAKFDKTVEDDPLEPVAVVTQETITDVSVVDAMLFGWVPKDADVEASGTVQIQTGDSAGPRVGD
jgi:hypothetical protein